MFGRPTPLPGECRGKRGTAAAVARHNEDNKKLYSSQIICVWHESNSSTGAQYHQSLGVPKFEKKETSYKLEREVAGIVFVAVKNRGKALTFHVVMQR